MVDFKELRKINLELARKKVKDSINEDNFLCQSINSIMETDKVINLFSKRLREWYSLYNPEFERTISDNVQLAKIILKKPRKQLLKEINISESMGQDLKKPDLDAILALAKEIIGLDSYEKQTKDYLGKLMEAYCPNLNALAGTTIGAKLIEHTGSLKKLALMPSSTIQVLGAEKALFRHIKSGSKPPKYGLIFDHHYIQQAKKPSQGKIARTLADKLSLAIRSDYFKGKFIADKLKKEIEAKNDKNN